MRRIRSSLAGTAHLFHSGGQGGLTGVSAAITQLEGVDVTLRCARPGTLMAGELCVATVATQEGQRRARAVVVEVTDVTTRIRLKEALTPVERSAFPRADVVLRMMVRALAPRASASRAQSLSVVPEGGWRTEEVVLSGTGLRGPLGDGHRVGDRIELRLHIPGRNGGDHFVTAAEVIERFDDQEPPEHAVRFVDLPDAARLRLSEIVDEARLEGFAEDAW